MTTQQPARDGAGRKEGVMDEDVVLDLEIRGHIGYITRKHKLSEAVSADIYKVFCEQAQRWGSKVHAHRERIGNQRKQITRLLALTSAPEQPNSATLMGRTKKAWLNHVEAIFNAAHALEEIPQSALLYAWPGDVTQVDKDWADSVIGGQQAEASKIEAYSTDKGATWHDLGKPLEK